MMVQFWIFAALLIVVALSFVLLPIWVGRHGLAVAPQQSQLNLTLYKERLDALQREFSAGELEADAYQALKLETERALLVEADAGVGASADANRGRGARWLPLLAAVLLVPLTLGLYNHWGAAPQLALSEQLQKAPQTREEMISWLQAMEQGLGERPAPEQLYNLARSYQSLRELDQAARLYQRLLVQEGPQAELYAQLGQLRFIATADPKDRSMAEYLEKALALDADNLTALGLAGIRAFELQAYSEAIKLWRRALELEPAGEGADALKVGIERAEAALGATGGAGASEAGSDVRRVELQILPPKGKVLPASAKVFVFARASNGPSMPLAVDLFTADQLPRSVVLDSEMGMTEGMSLNDFDAVDLVARVSLSGDVKAADFEAVHRGFGFGDAEPVTLHLQPVAQ